MFGLSRLLSKDKKANDHEKYINVSSLIEDGSVLDRRKHARERRKAIERRASLSHAFAHLEKRAQENRRSNSDRRSLEQQSENHEVKQEEVGEIRLSGAEILVHDQIEIIKKVSELSSSAKSHKFQGIKEEIREIAFKIKSITLEEEKLLYLSFEKNTKIPDEKTDKSLTEILFYIHDTSDQVLEYLDRYYYVGVTDSSVGFFLLDMNIVHESLKESLKKKQKHLYPMYN